jgi:hypothetical protein
MSPSLSAFIADLIMATHAAAVLFNIAMAPLAWAGRWRGWGWVRRRWVRWAHLGMMGLIAVQAVAGRLCPLTIWEQALRERAGQTGYEGSFIGQYVGSILYWDVPPWVFLALYVGWFGVVVWTWRRVESAEAAGD